MLTQKSVRANRDNLWSPLGVRHSISEGGHVTTAIESRRRSLAKAFSWRIAGSLDTFLLSLIMTGNAYTASSIASVEIGTKMALYYLHERAWSWLGSGHGRQPVDPIARSSSYMQGAPLNTSGLATTRPALRKSREFIDGR
jgi:uncharacterized membrane protein